MSITSQTQSTTIAILGSTSHIAKNVIYYLGQNNNYRLILFARAVDKVQSFLEENKLNLSMISVFPYEHFNESYFDYDVIINCIGVTKGSVLKEQPHEVFHIGEKFDNYVLQYIKEHPDCLYIHISSGAVYGGSFETAVNSKSTAVINVNDLKHSDYYGITKLYLEAKHRSLKNLNIVDLRVFSFYSRFIDLSSSYLLSDIINCVMKNESLKTTNEELVRDFLHPLDLINIIELCISKRKLNAAFDLYSKKAITKLEILQFFQKKYNLKYELAKQPVDSIGGQKKNYISDNHKAVEIGYSPRYSSLDCIGDETAIITNNKSNK